MCCLQVSVLVPRIGQTVWEHAVVNLTLICEFLEGVDDRHHIKNSLTILHVLGQYGLNAVFYGAGVCLIA